MNQNNVSFALKPLFLSRRTFVNKGLSRSYELDDILLALERHRNGDWAECAEDTQSLNQRNIERFKGLVFSSFSAGVPLPFYIVTDLETRSTWVRPLREFV